MNPKRSMNCKQMEMFVCDTSVDAVNDEAPQLEQDERASSY